MIELFEKLYATINQSVTCLPFELTKMIAQYACYFPIVFPKNNIDFIVLFPNLKTSILSNAVSTNASDKEYHFHSYDIDTGVILLYSNLSNHFQTYTLSLNPITMKRVPNHENLKKLHFSFGAKIIMYSGLVSVSEQKLQLEIIEECHGPNIVCKLSDTDVISVPMRFDCDIQKIKYFSLKNNKTCYQKLTWIFPTAKKNYFNLHFFGDQLLLMTRTKFFIADLKLPLLDTFQPLWRKITTRA